MKNIGIQMKDGNNNNVYPNPFPVGAIYMSVDSRNPSQIFGGTWEQIKDKFLLCAGTTYKPGTSGGNANHSHTTGNCTLTSNQMPSHSHSAGLNNAGGHNHVLWFGGGANSGNGGQIPVANSRWGQDLAGQTDGAHDHGGVWVAASGGNQAHNHGNTGSTSNMPPYIAVYVWRRTA